MSRSAELHDLAMDLADQGDRHRRAGEHDAAREVFGRALALEREAALIEQTEPSRGILLRSAAWLALEAEDAREAERLAAVGLGAVELPERVANELRAVMEDARVRIQTKLPPPSMVASIALHLEGPEIGYGEADPADFLPRVEHLRAMVVRAAERRARQPFRRAGQPKLALRQALKPRLQVEPGSVIIRLVLGGPQQELWDENAALVDEIIDCFQAIDDPAALALRIPEADYRENFVALAEALAPDGQRVSTVGLVGATRGRSRAPVSLRVVAPSRRVPLSGDGAGVREITGELRGADETGKTNRIRVVSEDGKATSVVVSDALMEDIVRPFYGDRVRLRVRGQNPPKMVGLPERMDG